jgi:hypothetical protein
MHDILSARLVNLAKVNTSPEAKKSQKSELFELAKLCQIVPINNYLLDAVAGPLTPAVQLVFGAASLIVALTELTRRQVYFAVIANLQSTGQIDALEASAEKRRKLVERLILASSSDLIAEHFGSCPTGYLRLLARLGDRAREPNLYVDLHKLIKEVPNLAKDLLAVTCRTSLSSNLLAVIMNMPPSSDAARLARKFEDVVEYDRFIEMYRILTGKEELGDQHRARLCAGENPNNLLDSIYLDLPFPTAAISAPGLRYIQSGAELVNVAKTYRNCLSSFVAEALRGEHQYYIWTKKNAPSVVLNIRNEAPFGWFLAETKCADNSRVPSALKQELKALLNHCGVRTERSVENMMRIYRDNSDFNDYEDLFDHNVA